MDSKISGDSLKKPRTVHIDVYCTGTEMESSDSSDSSEEGSKTASTAQTVFENQKMRVSAFVRCKNCISLLNIFNILILLFSSKINKENLTI